MTENTQTLAIMFLELAGGSQLYDTVPNLQAQTTIDDCLKNITRIVKRCSGIVIKSIGDGLMCRFDDANQAVTAACAIHETIGNMRPVSGRTLSVAVGLNYGPVIEENEDVFGDAVNLAARLKGLARSGQILTTEALISQLNAATSPQHRSIERTQVKGKQEVIDIYEILWQPNDATSLFGIQNVDLRDAVTKIVFRYGAQEREITADTPDLLIGRDLDCDLAINSKSVSRMHAHITYRRGKFILLDHSTNGTLVRTQDSKSVYLRREEIPLWGRGVISLGKPLNDDDDDLIHFICY